MKLLLQYFSILIFTIILSGCTFLNDIKEVKNDILGSINYTKDHNANEQQIQKQYLSYIDNFSNDKIVSFSYKKFDPSLGKTGLWIPMKFIEEVGGGVYFIDSFDPKKIPVFFIHGAGGNPREWISIAKSLPNEYQVVVVSYPSGMRLGISARVIYEAISHLIQKYEYKEFSIIAHSMGGLVSKKIIDNMSMAEREKIKRFITISTPWGGDELASRSANLSYTLPYWIDMQPNSVFLKEIYYRKLPESLKHYLFFGFKGEITLTKGISNDGVVTINSQLHPVMQNNASKVLGFNETHTSILKSQEVISKILELQKGSDKDL